MPNPPTGTVTFLLTDIEGSTVMWEHDSRLMAEAVAWHDSVMRETIERYGGYVFTTAGDSFAAAFGDPMSASAAAVEIQKTMRTREWGDWGCIRVRMGLDAGIAEERDGDYFGPPVNRAARIMSLARGEEVLASHTAADLLRHHLEEGILLRNVGERELRGVARPETVYSVLYGPEAPEPPAPVAAGTSWKPWQWAALVGVVALVVVAIAMLGGGESGEPEAVAPTDPPAVNPPELQPTAPGPTDAPPQATAAPEPTEPPSTISPQEAEALAALSNWLRSPLDPDGGSGANPAIGLGRDGEKVIAFNNPSAGDLRIAICRDAPCRAVSRAILDRGGVGEWPSAAVGSDGLAIVSYYDRPNGDLKVAHCEDRLCNETTITVVDEEGDVGSFSSLAIDGAGNAVISYFDATNTALKVAYCTTPDCADSTVTTVDDSGDVGSDTAITIAGDGLPVIGYNDRGLAGLRVAHCDAVDCSLATVTAVDTGGPAGTDTAITIGNSLPLVTYRVGDDVTLVRCLDAFCAAVETVRIASVPGGGGTAVAWGLGDVPVIAFHDSARGARLARCVDAACSDVTLHTVDDRPGAGAQPSLFVLANGVPVVAYFDQVDVTAWVAVPEIVGRP